MKKNVISIYLIITTIFQFGPSSISICQNRYSKIIEALTAEKNKLIVARDAYYKNYIAEKEKTFLAAVVGEIKDRDGKDLYIWGTAQSLKSEDFHKEGAYVDKGNIMILNASVESIYANYYNRGEVYYVGKKYGKNAFGVSVPIYIYQEKPFISTSLKENFTVIRKCRALIQLYDSLIANPEFSWLENYTFFSSPKDSLILVGRGNFELINFQDQQIELSKLIMKGKFGFVNNKNKVVIPIEYEYAEPFREGLALIRINGKYGFINKRNVTVIPTIYENARSFHEGLASVSVVKNGKIKYGFIDLQGKMIIEPKFAYASDFVNGLAICLGDGKLYKTTKYGEVQFFTDDKLEVFKLLKEMIE
jgi:hypothetical protein